MRISIPKPCHEDWNEMSPELQGAFCKVCSKTVIDFSLMSDEEIVRYLEKKGKEKTCGRFYASQLSPYEFKVNLREIPVRRSFSKIFVVTLFLIFTGLFVCKSDTGDILSLKINSTFPADTAALALSIDTIASPSLIDTASTETLKQTISVMGGVSLPQEIINPERSILIGDTTVLMRETAIQGQVSCSKPADSVIKDNLTPITQPKHPMMMGKMRIKGDIEY